MHSLIYHLDLSTWKIGINFSKKSTYYMCPKQTYRTTINKLKQNVGYMSWTCVWRSSMQNVALEKQKSKPPKRQHKLRLRFGHMLDPSTIWTGALIMIAKAPSNGTIISSMT